MIETYERREAIIHWQRAAANAHRDVANSVYTERDPVTIGALQLISR
jgi:hypothetical protein